MKNLIPILLLLFCINHSFISAKDTLKIHFLYGSVPKNKDIDDKWFGGKLGGHVGLQLNNDDILNFLPKDGFHYIRKMKNFKSTFATHTFQEFYEILGGSADSNKKLIIEIPLTDQQSQKYKKIKDNYLKKTPYDYAFKGMRCGSSSYEILAQLGIVNRKSNKRTYLTIFYPKKLRKILIKKAKINNWKQTHQQGCYSRIWEKD